MYDKYQSPLSERYASKEMQYIFSPDKKFKTWRKLWIALAETEYELGLDSVTKEQIEELKAHAEDINFEVAKEREKEVRHDVMSHVYAYGVQCPNAKGIIHLGATSCYVGDNTDIIIMTEALKLVRTKVLNVISELASFSMKYTDLPTLAFTHSYEELSDPERLSSIFSVMQAHSRSFADVGIIGMDGKHVAYVGPFDLRTADYTSAEWFQAVLRRGVYVSDVFMGYRNVPHFIIAVLRHEGSRSFILRATIDMEAIGALLQRLYSAGSSDAFLVNEEGILQTPSRHYGSSMGHFALPLKMEQLRKGGIVVEKLATPSSLQPTTSSSARAAVAMMRLETMPWILVVVDDLSLAFGTLRLKGKGSDGGHNGLKHIAATLGTQEYARLRFGIGNDFPRGGQIDYVLSPFTEEEYKLMPERLETAGEIIQSFCLAGLDITMNQFNHKKQ